MGIVLGWTEVEGTPWALIVQMLWGRSLNMKGAKPIGKGRDLQVY